MDKKLLLIVGLMTLCPFILKIEAQPVPAVNTDAMFAFNEQKRLSTLADLILYTDEPEAKNDKLRENTPLKASLTDKGLFKDLYPKYLSSADNLINTTAGFKKITLQDTVEGQVLDRDTGEPLPGVNILVKGTTTGTSTDADGRFQLTVENLQATLVVTFIGYQRMEVPLSGRSTIEIFLSATSLGLDEIVVTGTGGNTTRREIGNTVSSVSLKDMPAAQTNIDNVLTGNIPGATLTVGTAQSGAAALIRLRGSSSISMSNDPLVYIDGVRIARGGYPKTVSPSGFAGRSNNSTPSPLNDLNPNDIERVEVIKGAAATTLYGTEAAAGVIQIFTKSGFASGKPRWSLDVNQGFNKMQKFGPSDFPYMRIDPFLKNGYNQRYNLSVGGGSQDIQYFVSGTYGHSEGVLPDDHSKNVSFRGNFDFSPYDFLKISWNTSVSRNGIQNPPAGNNAQGLTINAFRGLSNYFASEDPDIIGQVLDFKIHNTINHFITGGTINLDATDFWSHKFNLGYDVAQIVNRAYRPLGFSQRPLGKMSTQDWTSSTVTVDYLTNLEFKPSEDISLKSSFGAQYVETENINITGQAENFSAPGEPTLSGGGTTLAFESRVRQSNYGFFGQELIGYKNKYFLTLGLRFDANSAFGENLGLKAYPKVSLSYIVSDESFWNESWGTFKLRAAYGHAGQAPGVFDAVRTWDPNPYGGEPAFTPNTLGNPDLSPERSIERTFGFDAQILDDRVNIEFTYYNQLTKDALIPVPQIPSKGFLSSQLDNAGRIINYGIELSVNTFIIQRSNFDWNVGINLATNHSEVLSLSGSAPFSSGGGWIEEGYPVPAIRGRKVVNADKYEEPVFYDNGGYYIYGPNNPVNVLGVNMSFGLPLGLRLTAKAQYEGGGYIYDGASNEGSLRSVQHWPVTAGWNKKIVDGQRDQLTALQRSLADQSLNAGSYSLWVYPSDNIRLQEVALVVPLESLMPTLINPSLTFSARNIRLWLNKDFLAFDPGMVGDQGINTNTRAISEQVPAPMSFTATLKVNF